MPSEAPLPCPFCHSEMAYARNNKYCWHRHDVECVLARLSIFFEVAAWNHRPAKRDECLHKCKDGEIISYIGGEPSIPKPCPIHGPKSGEGA